MEYFETPDKARKWCNAKRKSGLSIGYVPTMGALHEGHLSLVERSVRENDRTLVSIFVNPLQFNNPEDLALYPDTMKADQQMLQQAGCDLVYSGQLSNFFPGKNHQEAMLIKLPCKAITGLEAKYRPGHLEGVQAIVTRLFAVAGASRSYFGEKDFQQALVVRELAERQGDVEVIVCPTVREKDGLAMSSRNRQMNPEERIQARTVFKALESAELLWRGGERSPALLGQVMTDVLNSNQAIRLEYAEIRDPLQWTAQTPLTQVTQAQALIAVYIGKVRLIDNCRLGRLLL